MGARSSPAFRLALAVALFATSAQPGCAAAPPPPPDLFNGPAYEGRESWGPPSDDAAQSSRTAGSATTSRAARTTITGAALAGPESTRPRVLVRSAVHVLASDGANVIYGDDEQNALMTVPATGGHALLLARPGPLDLALDGASVIWIGRPGNGLFRLDRNGGSAGLVGEPGSFTAVAARGGTIFVGERVATGGAVTAITGGAATRLTTLEARPRAIEVDDANVYVVTDMDIERVPRAGGITQTLAAGGDFAHPRLDGEHVYVTAPSLHGRALVRVPKGGGPVVEVIPAVRAAPFAVYEGALYYFAPDRPELLRARAGGGEVEVVARDEAFRTVTTLALDARRVYVGTESQGLVAFPRIR